MREPTVAPNDSTSLSHGEFRRHWLILLGCGLGLAVGPVGFAYYTAGVFFGPLEQEFGWTRTQLSLGPSLMSLGVAITAPFVGMLADRHGERFLIAASMLLLCGALAGMSLLRQPVALYYLSFIAIAVLGAGASTLTFSRVVARHFDRSRGLALGIALTGTGLASMAGPPLMSAVIADLGWRPAYLVMAAMALLVTPLILTPLLRERRAVRAIEPESKDSRPSALGQPLRDPLFWRIAIPFALVLVATVGMAVHLVPLLTDTGASRTSASATAGLIGLSMVVSRLCVGWLIDRWFAGWVGAACLAVGAAGLALLAIDPLTFSFVGALAIGLVMGVEFDLLAYLIAKYFGIQRFGRLYGVAYALAAIGAAVSPSLYGMWADYAGNYGGGLLAGAAILLVAALAVSTLPRFYPEESQAG
jgi:MFS family permease